MRVSRGFAFAVHCSRCQLSARWCQENQNNANLRCTINKPVKYVYTFIALPGKHPERSEGFHSLRDLLLVARLRTPTEVFRIRNSQLTTNQHAEFDLRLIRSHDPFTNLTQTSLSHFELKRYPPHNAHLIVVKELNALEEIELHIQMKIFTNNILNSISVMKILLYISQYDFYP